MATLTLDELRQLSEQAQAFAPEVAARPPSAFLSLAPTMSASYPKTPNSGHYQFVDLTPAAPGDAAKVDGSSSDYVKRRSSSSGSAKSPPGFRFLKLGPVHWGEHQGDHKEDWHEVAVE